MRDLEPGGQIAHGESALKAGGFEPLDQQAIGLRLNRFLHFGKVYEEAIAVPKSGTGGRAGQNAHPPKVGQGGEGG
jgi:hypothetical protein